ncbi:NCS2 family permease [Desulfovibrio litoralis]|uniref:Putative MFS transporter, AGZA family, xanthine/uracil permease n=1 Tax=Desulfovibrio litoralis DSM 11393 TaxID=1121455 RepID=A0A1M7SMD3_9BACT|nr:NCS2 family permease [Desulfovibrio litoralis]SHN59616.1 putative MFS transporter, AGZA family, xanthine/uracil permease [Desulfovibrio litoralis DSM 11393]
MSAQSSFLDKFFSISKKGSTVKTEILAGVTTFMAVSYIIFVNPNIMHDAGMPKEAAIAATIYATIFASLLMGLWANFPIAVAPGMGLNAFFAYYVCGKLGLPWQVALGAVFLSGVIFILLTVTNIRKIIIESVPRSLKSAIVVGIGLFISFIGLQNAGIVVSNPNTFVSLGHMSDIKPILTCIGLLVTAILISVQFKGAILCGILTTTILGMAFGDVAVPQSLDQILSFNLPSLAPVFLQLDIMGALNYGIFSILFTMTIVELFDNVGTLIGVSSKANMIDKDGHIENLDRALISDATGTIASSLIGTSTVTSYVESAAGVAEGGRTGLVAIVVAILFAFSLIFAPLIGVVPAFATAPALIIIGAYMLMEITHIKFDDFTETFPAFMTIIMMPLTYSIASGFGFGFISYTLLKACSGRIKEVSLIMWLISLAFAVNFYLR